MPVSRETWTAVRFYVMLVVVLSGLLVAVFMIVAAVLIAYQ
jgi:hypothetical protein